MKKIDTKQIIRLSILLALLLPALSLACDCSVEHKVDQKNKAFSFDSITIKVGDRIKFVNSDSYFHNVYSLSETAQFDLGSYPKGDSRTITFDKVGKIVAQCAIHPQMKIVITVDDKIANAKEKNAETESKVAKIKDADTAVEDQATKLEDTK